MEACEFDKFRSEYHMLTPFRVAEFYRSIHTEYPNQKYFSHDSVVDFFNLTDSRHVAEIGGADGALAATILNNKTDILSWDNYEIAAWGRIDDPRYRLHVNTDTFFYHLAPESTHDTVVMSHVLEHISIHQARLINLDSALWVYIDYPERPASGWFGTCAHVSEMNVAGVRYFMRDRGFRMVYERETGTENSVAMGFAR